MYVYIYNTLAACENPQTLLLLKVAKIPLQIRVMAELVMILFGQFKFTKGIWKVSRSRHKVAKLASLSK